MKHLSRVASNGTKTGMTPKNLAIVWAPNLLRCKDLESSAGVGALHFIGVQAILTEYLIRYIDVLFNKNCYSSKRSPPRVSSTLRPKSMPVSSSRLLSLEEARDKRGIVMDSSNFLNQDHHINENFHTVINLRKRRGDRDNIQLRLKFLQTQV